MRLLFVVAVAASLALAAAHDGLRGSNSANFAAWAGEEDKAAWAGLEDPLRVSANAVRVKDGQPPLAAEPTLTKTALSLAQDLAKADSPKLDVNAGGKDLLARAQENGYNGTAVKANVFVEPARNETDVEGATLAAIGAWTKDKAAWAVMDETKHKMVGSGGYFSDSGNVYYAQVYGS